MGVRQAAIGSKRRVSFNTACRKSETFDIKVGEGEKFPSHAGRSNKEQSTLAKDHTKRLKLSIRMEDVRKMQDKRCKKNTVETAAVQGSFAQVTHLGMCHMRLLAAQRRWPYKALKLRRFAGKAIADERVHGDDTLPRLLCGCQRQTAENCEQGSNVHQRSPAE